LRDNKRKNYKEKEELYNMRTGENGQGMVEYALILLLVVLIVIVVLAVFGPTIGNTYSNVVINI
jgi:pilus assembly protein Flp/PilA